MRYPDYSYDKFDYDSYGNPKSIDRRTLLDIEIEAEKKFAEFVKDFRSKTLSDEEVLERMDIKVIETWLRKKKLKKLSE